MPEKVVVKTEVPDRIVVKHGSIGDPLTPATNMTLGGVIIGDNQGLSIDANGVLSVTATGIAPATKTTLGVVEVPAASNLTISAKGDIDYILPAATRTTLGGVIPATHLLIAPDGKLSVDVPSLGLIPLSSIGTANGVAPLDPSNRIPSIHMPPIAINKTYVVADEPARLLTTANIGDVCVQDDIGKTYILQALPATDKANWIELKHSDSVIAVNGKTGSILLNGSDIPNNVYSVNGRSGAIVIDDPDIWPFVEADFNSDRDRIGQLESDLQAMQQGFEERINHISAGINHSREVISFEIQTPVDMPKDGDAYIVDVGGLGEFRGKDNQIAVWNESAYMWEYTTPDKGESHFVYSDGKSYVWNGTDWVVVFNGIQGPKGDKGDRGAIGNNGKDGGTMRALGSTPLAANLPATPVALGSYLAADNKHLYIYDPTSTAADLSTGYVDMGDISGPKGDKGDAGETLKISGAVANEAALPAHPGNLAVYIAADTAHLYIYDKTSAAAKPSGYVDLGAIAGPQGLKGDKGDPGKDGNDAIRYWVDGQYATGTVVISNKKWYIARANVNVGDLAPGATPTGTQVQNWSDITPQSDKYIPFFTGKYSVGSYNATTNKYDEPRNPLNGDIWVDKSASPPTFNVYKSGSWVRHDFARDKYSLGLLGDLANVDLGSSTVEQGDSLIYNRLSEKWIAGQAPGHIVDWDKSVNYSAGTTVHYQGRFWRCKSSDSGTEPKIDFGDCVVFYQDGSRTRGPVIPTFLHIVADETATPTDAPTKQLPYTCIQYKDDTHWSIWMWDLDLTGWTSGMPVPSRKWIKKTALGGNQTWRNIALPSPSATKNTLWIFGPQGSTMTPKVGQMVWEAMAIGDFLVSLADVDVTVARKGDVLTSDGAGKWNAAEGSYSRTEIDTKVNALISGMTHGENVLAITGTPPAAPSNGMVYIVGASPTGAFAGHLNDVAIYENGAWSFVAPANGDSHMVDNVNEIWHWNGTAWVKVGSVGLNYVKIGQAAYTALAVKDPQTLYLISGA